MNFEFHSTLDKLPDHEREVFVVRSKEYWMDGRDVSFVLCTVTHEWDTLDFAQIDDELYNPSNGTWSQLSEFDAIPPILHSFEGDGTVIGYFGDVEIGMIIKNDVLQGIYRFRFMFDDDELDAEDELFWAYTQTIYDQITN